MFKVVSKTQTREVSNLISTIHFGYERTERLNKVLDIIGGYGKSLNSFIVDTAHPNGNEVHTITDNGIIIIQNERTNRLVTILIARPNQIRRYYEYGIPIEVYSVINKCKMYQERGYNYW